MTDTPPRPSSVPLAAVWLASAGEWQRGELVNGKLEGKVQNWRKDGTLCCEANYVDGEADGPFCRTHENGEASQFGAMAKGKRSGLCTWVRSTAPTTEIPGMPNPLIWRVEADFSPDTQSIQRQFDKSGNELNGQAIPIPQRPTGVAPFATYVLRGSGTLQLRLWEDGRSRMTDGRRVGLWRVWDEEGRLFEEVEYEATSTNYRLFLSDGSLALHGACATDGNFRPLAEFPGAGRAALWTPLGRWHFGSSLPQQRAPGAAAIALSDDQSADGQSSSRILIAYPSFDEPPAQPPKSSVGLDMERLWTLATLGSRLSSCEREHEDRVDIVQHLVPVLVDGLSRDGFNWVFLWVVEVLLKLTQPRSDNECADLHPWRSQVLQMVVALDDGWWQSEALSQVLSASLGLKNSGRGAHFKVRAKLQQLLHTGDVFARP